MTQEEKQLLLKDICARLPYGVKYCRDSWNYEWDQEMSVVEVLEDIDKDGYINYHKVYKIEDIKPYLRPLSSMTEEEKKEYKSFFSIGEYSCGGSLNGEEYEYIADSPDDISQSICLFDWLNAHHFDYRGLIPKGLALEAPEDMYKTE